MRYFSAAILIVLFVSVTAASAFAEDGAERIGDVVDHAPLQELLEDYVDDRGMIAYGRLHASESDREVLADYLEDVAGASASGKSREAQLAFLINAYNALVIHAVLERWPVENVIEEEGFFDGDKYRIARAQMTLDELDKKVIRRRFQEPRVNFVLVCAAKSCPRLLTTAMTEKNLERNLQAATEEYIPRATRLRDDGTVETSQLFEWYAGEFEAEAGSVADYLARFIEDERLAEALGRDGVEVVFKEYDWSINDQ